MWPENVQNELSQLLPDLAADVPEVRQKAGKQVLRVNLECVKKSGVRQHLRGTLDTSA